MFIVENSRAELLYSQFLDWRMGLDAEDALSLAELREREGENFTHWLAERNEAPCVY